MKETEYKLRVRETIRLQGFDYGSSGAYFVTIRSLNGKPIFSEIKNGEITLSGIGEFIRDEWERTPAIRKYVTIDEYVIMPNHFHAILFIHKDSDEPDHLRQTGTYLHFPEGYQNKLGPQCHNLSSIIRGFKGAVVRRNQTTGGNSKIWQNRFFERIVRNEKELDKFRLYIRKNPHKWGQEDEHPFISYCAA